MNANIQGSARRSLAIVREQLAEATAAKKCHGCGCLQATVAALEATDVGREALTDILDAARAVFAPKQYDCLGCAVCFPALAANAFAEEFPDTAATLDLCPTDEAPERPGWPPLPGDYRVLRYGASVAVCVLNSQHLIADVTVSAPAELSIVGTMHTENLGIERIIKTVLANPNIRFLVLCGEDTRQAIGHLPGQSLASLFRNGIDDRGRIIGASGKRPVLKNVSREEVRAFIRQVELVDHIGETSAARIAAVVEMLGARNPGPFSERVGQALLAPVVASEPVRLTLDPAGFFVVYPDTARRRLVLEHYSNAGVLDSILHGATPAALYSAAAERGLVTRLDHAAYLGRELARAERSLETGEPYVQDRAAGALEDAPAVPGSCGCSTTCGGAV
jgi:tetrahydromethanopterin S-methyltransferase subunit A